MTSDYWFQVLSHSVSQVMYSLLCTSKEWDGSVDFFLNSNLNKTTTSKSFCYWFQVLSRSVSQVMSTYYAPAMDETARSIGLVDRFLDCLNGRSLSDDIRTRKPDLGPYRSLNGPRFQGFMPQRTLNCRRHVKTKLGSKQNWQLHQPKLDMLSTWGELID